MATATNLKLINFTHSFLNLKTPMALDLKHMKALDIKPNEHFEAKVVRKT
jgi:hypothetical protein